jgi:putative effector of murein hydrolase LrgA (UPF0299 family)
MVNKHESYLIIFQGIQCSVVPLWWVDTEGGEQLENLFLDANIAVVESYKNKKETTIRFVVVIVHSRN